MGTQNGLAIDYRQLKTALGKICPHCSALLNYQVVTIETKQGPKKVCQCNAESCGKYFKTLAGLENQVAINETVPQSNALAAPARKKYRKTKEGGRNDGSADTRKTKTKQRDGQAPAPAKSRGKKEKRERTAGPAQ